MTPEEAKEYVNQRFKEIELTDPIQKVNIILNELARQGFGVYLERGQPFIKHLSKHGGIVTYHV